MAKSKETFSKKEREKKRLKKRKEKQMKREERKAQAKERGGGFESMIAYVDEFGNFSDTPPDPKKRTKIDPTTIRVSTPKKGEIDLDALLEGRVEYFNHSKGFGFIKDNQTHEKYFVHIKSLSEPLEEGDKVTFEGEQGLKGMNAVNVTKL